MPLVRFVAPTLLLVTSLVASARSEPQVEKQPTRPNLLAGCLKVGEHVALTTSPNGAYHIRVISQDELDKIRQEAKEYPPKRQEYEAKAKELTELQDKARAEYDSLLKERIQQRNKIIEEARDKAKAGDSAAREALQKALVENREAVRTNPEIQSRLAKLQELEVAMGKLVSPRSPITPYEVTIAGHDFVAVTDDDEEIFIPWNNVLDVRRKAGSL